MARARSAQRQSRLTNPVVATKMYEALVSIANLSADGSTEQHIANEALSFVRDKEAVDDAGKEN